MNKGVTSSNIKLHIIVKITSHIKGVSLQLTDLRQNASDKVVLSFGFDSGYHTSILGFALRLSPTIRKLCVLNELQASFVRTVSNPTRLTETGHIRD